MGMEKISVPVEELAVGMYVAALDRPWLETPFLFQGFLIENQETIEQLQQFCTFVYIDAEKADRTIVKEKLAAFASSRKPVADATKRGRAGGGSKKAASVDDTRDTGKDDTVLLKAELSHAREAHTMAERTVAQLMSRVQAGEDLDLPSLHQAFDPMIDSIMRNDDAMSWLARMKKKNDYVYDHSLASAIWAVVFGKHLGLNKEELHVLGMGAVFMDVGKTKVPNEILIKRDELTPAETVVMRRHVQWSTRIVSKIDGIDPRVIEMVACHHERYNGTGYPRRLSGSTIPVFARIAGIVDTYDAMTTPRPYAEPVSTYDAMRQLNRLAGVEFADEVVEQFVQAVGVFPVGTLVELNTGEVGVVIAQNRVRRLRPKLMLLLDKDKTPLSRHRVVDLRNQLADAEGTNSLWIERGLAPGDFGLDPSEYYL